MGILVQSVLAEEPPAAPDDRPPPHTTGVEEARASLAEAVEIRRRLAGADPAAHEDELASSLNSLGIRLSDLGRTEEALAATSEVVEIRRAAGRG